MSKQTVVEWLEQALEGTILTHEQIMQIIGLFEQAKEMHKQEMNKCWDEAKKSFSDEEFEK